MNKFHPEFLRCLEFLNNAEARDKFAKILQFLARFLAGFFRDVFGNENLGLRCEHAWRAVLDARRVGWLLKFLAEAKTVSDTIADTKSPGEVRLMHVLARGSFLLRWCLENAMNFYRLEILKGRDWRWLNKWAKRMWASAIFFGILTELCKLKRLYGRGAASWGGRGGEEGGRHEEGQEDHRKKTEAAHQATRNRCLQMLACHFGDMGVPAFIGFERNWSDMRIGAGHLVSAVIQCKNLWPAAK